MALYDPQEFPAETRTDFSLSEILAWARMKPADEGYDYCSNGHCAIAQFLRETGRAKNPLVDIVGWCDGPRGNNHPYDTQIAAAANCASRYSTFGAFADRLEKVLAA
jgi:hypothetical protein